VHVIDGVPNRIFRSKTTFLGFYHPHTTCEVLYPFAVRCFYVALDCYTCPNYHFICTKSYVGLKSRDRLQNVQMIFLNSKDGLHLNGENGCLDRHGSRYFRKGMVTDKRKVSAPQLGKIWSATAALRIFCRSRFSGTCGIDLLDGFGVHD
jgi:hypothetical protein